MIRGVRRLASVLALLLIALMANLTWIQFINAEDLRNAPDNSRTLLREYDRERGPVLLGSTAIASSVSTEDQLKYLRSYAAGPRYAPVTGFYSLVFGATGLERTENSVLAGTDDRFFVDRLGQLIAGRDVQGGAVRVTIDARAQRAAYEGLAGRTGAVVAIDPRTGAILALATSPSFDPNVLSSHDPAGIRSAYEEYQRDPDEPLANRPLTMTLPPGSTFKLVTAAAALENGYTPETEVPGPAQLRLPNSVKFLRNWTGQACGPNDTTTLVNAMAISCNTAFASIGIDLGGDVLRDQARKFGFGTSFTIPLRAAASQFPPTTDDAQAAQSAIGQYDVTASTLQMALVAAGIGNGGVVMDPYLVSTVLGPDLAVLDQAEPTEFSRAISPASASTLLSMMETTVEQGTATNGAIPGVRVGAKTGTAQTGTDAAPHAWFVSVAPIPSPQVAVAVVLQNGGGAPEVSGNALAGPIARQVMEAVLEPSR